VKLSADAQGVLLEGGAGSVQRFAREKQGNEWTFSAVKVAAEFKGYDLDAAGNPTFRAAGEGVSLTDAWVPASDGKPGLKRTLKSEGDRPVTVVLARDLASEGADGATVLGGSLSLRSLSGPQPKAADKLLTVTLKPGETAVLGYSFR